MCNLFSSSLWSEPVVCFNEWRNSTINYLHSYQSGSGFFIQKSSISLPHNVQTHTYTCKQTNQPLTFLSQFLLLYMQPSMRSFNTSSSDHFSYQKHKCTSAHKKDVQVPVCPLCSTPVPTPRGISPDMTVGQHIDQYCKSNKTKIFTNRCSFRGCKKKELVPVNCSQCKMNFCLRHRHSTDHECNPKAARSNLFA